MRFALVLVLTLVALLPAGGVMAEGDARERAIRALQRELGLPETGRLDAATQAALSDPQPPAALAEPEGSVSFDLDGAEAGPVELLPAPGSGQTIAEPTMAPDLAAVLSEASGIYAPYEMGGRSVRPETWVPFSVIGEDERVAVNDTTTFPERAIVQILFQNAFGSTSLCSGTMIAADTVLTAAHCIHSGTVFGRPYSAYRVLPGRNRAATPFGECGVRRAHVLQGWTAATSDEEARLFDLGALKLDCNVGEATGWAGVRVLEETELGAVTVVQGYAADKAPPGRQWVSTDSLRILWDLKGFYLNDTYGGTSGSPVFLDGDRAVLVGVHTNGLHGEDP
ncbi:trypsin-like serine protease [Rhodovulum strictum]|nr:trypsin-like serine protease [Rhodovulum strictum]